MKDAKNHLFSNPICALADLIKCRYCDGAMMYFSAKGGVRYGCSNAKSKNCNNKLRISRSQVEAMILNDLKEKFLTAESLKFIDEWVFKELARTIELAIVQEKGTLPHAQLIQMGSFYVAYTSIQAIALLSEQYEHESRHLAIDSV